MIFLGVKQYIFRFKQHFNEIFWFKQYLNDIFWFKQYLNKTKSFSFFYIHSTLVVSPIFTLNKENPTRTERYMNSMARA